MGLSNDIDIIQGTLAKAYGTIGGYIASTNLLIDAIACRVFGIGVEHYFGAVAQ